MASMLLSGARISLISPLSQANGAHKETERTAGSAEQWDRVQAEVLRLRDLPDDWDGQGASALDSANVDIALAWVGRMRRQAEAIPPSQVVPGVTGEIVLDWRGEDFYLIAEISKPDRVEWLLSLADQPAQQWETAGPGAWFVRAEH